VVTWNSAELTVRALRHLLDSEQDCDLRILVHDNGSEDGTPKAVADAVPEAELEVSPVNLGFAAAMNRLIGRGTNRWFWALNSDAWPEPGTLRRLVEAGEAHGRAAAICPGLLRPDGSAETGVHPFPSLSLGLLEASGARHWLPAAAREHLLLELPSAPEGRRVDWAVGAALLMRRAALEDVGGFDERYFMYVEDLDWCWRARRAGWEVRFEPAAVVRHVGNVSGERRFGASRLGLEKANLRTFLDEAMGRRRAGLYRLLQATASAEEELLSRVRGDATAAGLWRKQLRGHLGLLPAPILARPPASPEGGAGPKVAVVVPTRGRAGRLARLMTALEKQTLPPEDFEVIVVDDASNDDTPVELRRLAANSPLAVHVLRQELQLGPAAARNAGWRKTRAPVVAFTDDDCVPEPDWLRAGLDAMDGAARVVVGHTAPPADQLALASAPFSRVMEVDDTRFLETCNVFYRTVDLEAAGGFDERFRRPSGEDTDLGLRVLATGVESVYAPGAVVRHDVRPGDWSAALRESWRWVDLPLVLKGRPSARPALVHRLVFWKPTHPPALLAATGLVLGLWRRPALFLLLPWVWYRLRRQPLGDDLKAQVASLPGALVLDLSEVATMARGSLRHRTILL
jgi:GT2 family glycosyltransferase